VLDDLIVDAAERAGAEFRFGLSATDVSRDRNGRVDGVVVHDRRGRPWTEQGALVVGADGRESVVADRVAAPVMASGRGTGSYVYGYWPGTDLDGYHWYYGDQVSAGVIPTNDGLACVFAGGPAARSTLGRRDQRPAELLRSRLATVDQGLVGLTASPSAGALRWFRGLAPRVRRPFGEGWALVGDSGSWMDPLSTHGMTDAMRDAESLARAVVAGARSERAAMTAMREFQRHRDRVALRMHPVVDRLASHAWSHDEARPLLRTLASIMADEVEDIVGCVPLAVSA
jgi:flavin-dependent dehydrogenase